MEKIIQGVVVDSCDASFDEKRKNPNTDKWEKTGKRIEVHRLIIQIADGTFEPVNVAKFLDVAGTPNPLYPRVQKIVVGSKVTAQLEGVWNNYDRRFEFKRLLRID